jgi:hypothetical protein
MIGVRKFGPHHVVLNTSLSNLRLTTFFAGESEVKIVDPSRVSQVEAVGCRWKSSLSYNRALFSQRRDQPVTTAMRSALPPVRTSTAVPSG